MFADSLLESSGTQRTRRGWTTLSSFGLQALMMAVLLLLPLIRPIGLPFLKPLAAPVMLAPPPGLPPAQAVQRTTTLAQSNMINNLLIAPRSIPSQVASVVETEPPPQFSVDVGLPGSTGDTRGVPGAIGPAVNPVMPLPPPPVANHVRVSRMMEGNLIRRVQP